MNTGLKHKGTRAQRHPARLRNRVTREAVAKAAGVSLATITYALQSSDRLRIGEDTRRRVKRVAAQLGYRPNFIHRVLSAGKTYTIGLIVPEQKALLFPMYQLIIGGLLAAMNENDYDPLLLQRSPWDRVEKIVADGRVDGLVMLQSDFDLAAIERLAATGLPAVVANRSVPDGLPPRVGCVYSDHFQMIKSAVDELLALGCRSILNFCDARTTFANADLCAGFDAVLAEYAGRNVIGATIAPAREHFKPQARNVFEAGRRWDGIFTAGADVAWALHQEAQAQGLVLVLGRDFELIATDAYCVTEVSPRADPGRRCERAVYWQQPQLIGQETWRLFRSLLAGETQARSLRVPYRREGFNEQRCSVIGVTASDARKETEE